MGTVGESRKRGLGIRVGEIMVLPLSDCDLGQVVDLSGLHFPQIGRASCRERV